MDWKPVGRIIFYTLILTAVAQLIILQAIPVHSDDLYAEGSVTEWMQVNILGVTMLLFMCAGVIYEPSRSFNAGMVGLLALACVREMDRAFDRLYDGAWQVAAVFVLVITVLMVVHTAGRFRDELRGFMKRPAYGFFLSGVLTVIVFSRLYGQKFLWEAVMGEKFMYSVKAASEENTELLGYCLVLMSGIEWLARCRKEAKG